MVYTSIPPLHKEDDYETPHIVLKFSMRKYSLRTGLWLKFVKLELTNAADRLTLNAYVWHTCLIVYRTIELFSK